MFLNPAILEDKLKRTLAKYGLRTMDLDVMSIVSEAAKNKFSEIISSLIEINRSNHNLGYIS